jgi:hypothetical protein
MPGAWHHYRVVPVARSPHLESCSIKQAKNKTDVGKVSMSYGSNAQLF